MNVFILIGVIGIFSNNLKKNGYLTGEKKYRSIYYDGFYV